MLVFKKDFGLNSWKLFSGLINYKSLLAKKGFEPFDLLKNLTKIFLLYSSYTFPYSYLVTTSSKLSISQWILLKSSSETDSLQVTGGVYKAKLHVHRNVLICDY